MALVQSYPLTEEQYFLDVALNGVQTLAGPPPLRYRPDPHPPTRPPAHPPTHTLQHSPPSPIHHLPPLATRCDPHLSVL